MPVRKDRIRQYVNAWCGLCHRENPDRPLREVDRLPGYLSEADGRVWLVRGCPTHGRIVTLYDEDPEIMTWLERWTAPTKHHRPDTPGNFDPAPMGYARGLGELQTQHTCILLTDIVEGCNLACPTCFTDSPTGVGRAVPLEDVLANVDQRLARENGRLDVVMLSGGEPTLHPELPRLLDELCDRDIHRILINTNGVLLARDDELLSAIRRHDQRVEVYLQFDGFRGSTHRHHRGADLSTVKQRAITRLSEAEIFTTLTMTASLGVNDDEIGDVINLALATDYVGGVSVQPEFGSGRSIAGTVDLAVNRNGDGNGTANGGGQIGIDPLDRLTHTGVLGRLAEQTQGTVTWRDLTALPCSHPHCASVGYLIKTDDTRWRSLISLIGEDTLAQHLDLVANRITSPELARKTKTLVKEARLGVLSAQNTRCPPDKGQ
ncbi:MAG: radical SAM protein, partial [Actinomycetota bacterium]